MGKIDRREFLQSMSAVVATLAFYPGFPLPSVGKKAAASQNLTFYFPETGHNLEEPFLTFWRTKGGRLVFGDPITEINNTGMPIQYFQKSRMELHPNGQVMLGLLGSELYDKNNLPPLEEGPRHPKFDRFYDTRGRIEIFGNPISAPFTEDGRLVQIYERAKFRYHPEALDPFYKTKEEKYGITILALDEVQLNNLGEESAEQKGISTAAVDSKPEAIDFSSFNPSKRIYVDQGTQLLTAYEDDIPVIIAGISSGRPTAPTVVGQFYVLRKDLSLTYNSTDEYGKPYYYPQVPFNLLFESSGFFIHTAYWHEKFGKNPDKVPGFGTSRGCINMSLDFAEQLYRWASRGTSVEIGSN